MPPVKCSQLEQWVRLDKNLIVDGNVLFCKICSKSLNVTKKYHVIQHLTSGIHSKTLKIKNKSSQPLLREVLSDSPNNAGPSKSVFSLKLCEACIAESIPLKKLNNPILKEFLETTAKQTIPDESTLRKNYLYICYQSKLENIRQDIGDNYVWISIDETTDCKGRYIANFIVGKLTENEPGIPHYLLTSKELDKTNHKTVANFFDDSMRILYPGGIKKEKVLLLLIDAAPYMVKVGQVLQIFYNNMVHLTCLAHGLNRVCEFIREEFAVVNKLISSTKKIFLKAPLRVALYKERLPGLPLPPEPIITRWGSWISACLFYATHFDGIKEVVESFSASSALAIAKSQDAFKNPGVKNGLTFIRSNYSHLPDAINQLEKSGLSLTKSAELFNLTKAKIDNVSGNIGEKIAAKLNSVIMKNPGFAMIMDIAKIHQGVTAESVPLGIKESSALKFAPVTSCDVERSFSRYKDILSDKRHNLLPENIEKYLIISWETNKESDVLM